MMKKKNKKVLKSENIGSAGLVQILYKDKRGKYRLMSQHNTGKMPLFTFLTSALQGNPLYECAPNNLTAYYHYDQTVTEKSAGGVEVKTVKTVREKAFVLPLPIISAPIRMISDDISGVIDSDSSDIVQFSFLLPTTNIIKKDNGYIGELCLENARLVPAAIYVGEDDLKTCASMSLAEGELNPDATSNILIYWKIKISDITKAIAET